MSEEKREDSIGEHVADTVSSIVLWCVASPWLLIGAVMIITGEATTTFIGGLIFCAAGAVVSPPFIQWMHAEYAVRGEQPISQGWLWLSYIGLIFIGVAVST